MQHITGKVLITGGAGFLARGIYRRARREDWDVEFTALSRDDAKHAALQKRYPEVDTVLGDVGLSDVQHLADLMRGFDVVIHAAASKYVERAEHAALDTIQTNTIGSMKVAEAARRARVRRVVGISTDKAVQPVNNYGASKFLMERVFQEAARLGDTEFTVCRYGNVVGSTGSVIPMFMDWAERGLPIRLTDPRMTRFWMSVDEAIDVILQSLVAPSGAVVIPACRSMSMHDLVLMALGYPGHDDLPEDGRVEIIGLRPGEKLHEALVQSQESVRVTRVPVVDEHPGGAWKWLYIAPPDADPITSLTMQVTSDQPPLGWLGPEAMRAIIADSAEV